MASPRPNPDAWIYYSGKWPPRDAECWRAFLDDLLAEMETPEGLATVGAQRRRDVRR